MHILIVDDTPANRLLPSALLKKEGFKVSEAPNGETALEYLSREIPDCVLLDISMPGLSGEEVCERIRRDERFDGMRIIAYTAHALPEERKRIMAAGFNDLLTKPITKASLRTALQLD